MKRAIILFWKGLTGIISATAEWFTVILGMKDESTSVPLKRDDY